MTTASGPATALACCPGCGNDAPVAEIFRPVKACSHCAPTGPDGRIVTVIPAAGGAAGAPGSPSGDSAGDQAEDKPTPPSREPGYRKRTEAAYREAVKLLISRHPDEFDELQEECLTRQLADYVPPARESEPAA